MSYIGAQAAMHRRRMIESPSCAAMIMQQPDLGRLGRFIGPASVTLGEIGTVVDMNAPDQSTLAASTSSFSFSPWLIGGGLLLLGFLWYRSRSGGGHGHIIPPGVMRKFTNALYIGGAATGGYLLGKHF